MAVTRKTVRNSARPARPGRPACSPARSIRAASRFTRRWSIANARERQAAGEIDTCLDPAYVLLALFGAAMAPAVLPQFAENFTRAATRLTGVRGRLPRAAQPHDRAPGTFP